MIYASYECKSVHSISICGLHNRMMIERAISIVVLGIFIAVAVAAAAVKCCIEQSDMVLIAG